MMAPCSSYSETQQDSAYTYMKARRKSMSLLMVTTGPNRILRFGRSEHARQHTVVAYVGLADHCSRAVRVAKAHAMSVWRQLSFMCHKRAKRRSHRLRVSLHAEADPNAIRVSWDDRALSFGLYAVAQIHQGAIDADLAVGDVLHRVDGTDVLRSRVDRRSFRLVDALLRRPEGAECDFMRSPVGDGKNPPLLRTWTQIAFESSTGGLQAMQTPNEASVGSQPLAYGEQHSNMMGKRSEPGGDLVFQALGEEPSQRSKETLAPEAKVDNSVSAQFLRFRGHRSDGIRFNGDQKDEPWRDGYRSDGPRKDGYQSDIPRKEGYQSDIPRDDGLRSDGVWSDGFRSDSARGGFRSEGSEMWRRRHTELSDRIRGGSDLSDCPDTDWEFPSPHKILWRFGRDVPSPMPLKESGCMAREFPRAESSEPVDRARFMLPSTRGPFHLHSSMQDPPTIAPDSRAHPVSHGTYAFSSQLGRRSPHHPTWGSPLRHPAASSTAPIEWCPAPAPAQAAFGARMENANSNGIQSSSSKLSARAHPFVPSNAPYFGYKGSAYTDLESYQAAGYTARSPLSLSPQDTMLHRLPAFPSMVQCETSVSAPSYKGITWTDAPGSTPCVPERNSDLTEHHGNEAVVTEDDVAASFDFLNSPDRVSSECHPVSPAMASVRADTVNQVLLEDKEEKVESPVVTLDATSPARVHVSAHDPRPVISLDQLMPLEGDTEQGALPVQQDRPEFAVEQVRGCTMHQEQYDEQEHAEQLAQQQEQQEELRQEELQGQQEQENQQGQQTQQKPREEDAKPWWQLSFALSDILQAQDAALFSPETRHTNIPTLRTGALTHNERKSSDEQENEVLYPVRSRKHRRVRRRRTKSPAAIADETKAQVLHAAQPNPIIPAQCPMIAVAHTNGDTVDTGSSAIPRTKVPGYKPSLPSFLRKPTSEQREHEEQKHENAKPQHASAHPDVAAPVEEHADAECSQNSGSTKKDEANAKKVILTRVMPSSAVGWRPSLRPISSLLNPS